MRSHATGLDGGLTFESLENDQLLAEKFVLKKDLFSIAQKINTQQHWLFILNF